MGKWSFNDPNPIISYGIGFELATALSPKALREISALGASLVEDLPRKIEQQAFTFQVGQPAPQPEIGGVVFDELARDGTVRRQLAVLPNSITYLVSKYQRWIEFWPAAERIISKVSEAALSYSSVSALSLNAVNRFHWSEHSPPVDIAALVRSESKLVPPDLLARTGMCHSFYGFLMEIGIGSRIDNINFSLVNSPQGGIAADLVFNFRVLLKESTADFQRLFAENSNDGLSCRTIFHDLRKAGNSQLAIVIVPEMLRKIPGILTP